MRAVNRNTLKNVGKSIPNEFKGSTAYQIFHKDNQYPFLVDRIHFKMNNKSHEFPEYFGSNNRQTRSYDMSNDLIPTYGTIIQMSDYFHDGAVISIRDGKVAAKVYNTILKHMNAHLHEMRSNIHYVAPEDDVLRQISEFATAIRYKAMEYDKDIDDAHNRSAFVDSLRGTRAFINPTEISKRTLVEVKEEQIKNPPKSMQAMDAIERYLDMIGGYNG